MKKTITGLALFAFLLSLTACGGTNETSGAALSSGSTSASGGNSSASGNSSGLNPGSVITSANSGNSAGSPVITLPNLPTIDEPETVTGAHELYDGNFVYNPNVTDTSKRQRYYADFKWEDNAGILWQSGINEKPWEEYDWEAAVAYGKAHWDDGVGLCAPFISRCVTAGNITNYTESSTSITLQLLHSRLGFGQFLKYNKSDHTISMPDYARPGDVIQIYCSYEGAMIHSLLMVGTDEEGKLKAVCHNMRNSGTYTFHIDDLNDPCYDCDTPTAEVFFYHFYRDDDEGLPEAVVNNKDILLWEEKAYVIPDEKYDRQAALDYAKRYSDESLGYYGASNLSDILKAGGISVGYPNQSALFLQLLKSRLGEAYSQKVRADRTVILPQYAKAGDIMFTYCPNDGMIVSSGIISGRDDTSRMIVECTDLINDGTAAYKVDSYCAGCGDDIKEVIIYCFDD